MNLTKERENQIRDLLKYFPVIQAEKRMDMRKPAEVVDIKPILKELLAEVESLKKNNDELMGRYNGIFQQLGQTGYDLENMTKERDRLLIKIAELEK